MIRLGIFGYGNLGRGVELATKKAPDLTLSAIFTRRNPCSLCPVTADVPVIAANKVMEFCHKIDVLLLCGGSATDLPVHTPMLARFFNVVDSFDTHARIQSHFVAVDGAARDGGKVALIATGWDPGLFSLARLYASAILPHGREYTFWGKGVSQGHSDAIRRIAGVEDAKQYTIPYPSALQAVKRGEQPTLAPHQKHKRVCYVVANPCANKARIAHQIKTMPHYFCDYDTTVHFVTADELGRKHAGLGHGGEVVYSGHTGLQDEHSHVLTCGLKLDSNPEFTASVLVAFARAVHTLSVNGEVGAKTVFDVPPRYLSPLSSEELRSTLL